jgi:hypothetical protein
MSKVSDGYLLKLFRQAVLKKHDRRCVFCGNDNIAELDAHHIVHKRHRVLRWDWRNGVPVCRQKCKNGVDKNHDYADTLAGRDEIQEIIGAGRWVYLKTQEQYTLPAYCAKHGMSRDEFMLMMKDDLKAALNEDEI